MRVPGSFELPIAAQRVAETRPLRRGRLSGVPHSRRHAALRVHRAGRVERAHGGRRGDGRAHGVRRADDQFGRGGAGARASPARPTRATRPRRPASRWRRCSCDSATPPAGWTRERAWPRRRTLAPGARSGDPDALPVGSRPAVGADVADSFWRIGDAPAVLPERVRRPGVRARPRHRGACRPDRPDHRSAVRELAAGPHARRRSAGAAARDFRAVVRAVDAAAVVIDEALELARRFSAEEAVPFINGVLDGVEAPRSNRAS